MSLLITLLNLVLARKTRGWQLRVRDEPYRLLWGPCKLVRPQKTENLSKTRAPTP